MPETIEEWMMYSYAVTGMLAGVILATVCDLIAELIKHFLIKKKKKEEINKNV